MIQYTVHTNPSTGSVSLERTDVNTVDNNTTAINTVDSTGGYYGTIYYTNSQYQNSAPSFTTTSADFASKSDVEYRAVILKDELMGEIKLLRQELAEAMSLINTLCKFKEDIESGVDPIKLEKDDTMFESLFGDDK